jgi:hypothetical protein
LCHKQTSTNSFDHIVGAAKYWKRDGKAERLGCLEIDDQFDLCRLFDRNVGGLRALQQSDASVC